MQFYPVQSDTNLPIIHELTLLTLLGLNPLVGSKVHSFKLDLHAHSERYSSLSKLLKLEQSQSAPSFTHDNAWATTIAPLRQPDFL